MGGVLVSGSWLLLWLVHVDFCVLDTGLLFGLVLRCLILCLILVSFVLGFRVTWLGLRCFDDLGVELMVGLITMFVAY